MKSVRFLGFPLLAAALSLAVSTACLAGSAQSGANQGSGDVASGERAAKPQDSGNPLDLSKLKPITRKAPPMDGLMAYRKRVPAPNPADFGIVRKKLGGEVSITPAPPEVERALKEQGALVPAPNEGVSPADQDPAKKPNVDRTIFGADDRVWIRASGQYPYRAIGLLGLEYPNGEGGACSGTLVGDRYVLTAAHCLFSEKRHEYVSRVVFYPGRNGDNAPYGAYEAEWIFVPNGYANAASHEYDWDHVLNDMGMVRLSRPAGNDVGWLAFGYNNSLPPYRANIVGYPGDKQPPFTLWQSSCPINPADGQPNLFLHSCDAYPGLSGSSIYDPSQLIHGVHVADNPQTNTGIRITQPFYCWLLATMDMRC